MQASGQLVAFAAPSGGGKSTIIRRIRKTFIDFGFSISATTRSPRQGETDGVEYDFLSLEEFKQGIDNGDFVEYEEVHGNLYGTRKFRIQEALDRGDNLIFDLDVLGAITIKREFPSALIIYIDVPSVEVLRERLKIRALETGEVEADIDRRMERYDFECSKKEQFDHIVVNDELDLAVTKVEEAIRQHRAGVVSASQ